MEPSTVSAQAPSLAGPLARVRPVDPEMDRARDAAIWQERCRLYCLPKLRVAMVFRIMSSSGALAICLIVGSMSSTPWTTVALWLALVVAADIMLAGVTAMLTRRPPAAEDLQTWAAIKGSVATLAGLTWSLGPILLHQPGEPVTVLAPIWGLFMITAGIMYACAQHPPTLYAMTTATIVPAVIYLGTRGDSFSTMAALCTATSLPFAFGIGAFAVREVGAAIATRLDVADLLDRQVVLSREVKEAHDARTRFFSAASHDLRQPLQALGFYMTLLGAAETPSKQSELVGRMAECVDLLDRQFNAILGVAATDRAIERAIDETIPLAPLLDRVRASVAAEADVKRLDVRVVPTSTFARVAPEVLERVLVNLAGNAVRYTSTGRVVMGVRRHATSLTIVIADSGIGIDDREIPHIFEDFYQVDNPGRNRHEGFGLGLAIVRRLCNGMGWDISVHSRKGQGSRFCINVPRGVPEHVVAQAHAPDAADAGGLGHIAVLVVDDDAIVRDAASALLTSWNVAFETAASRAEVHAALARPIGPRRWVVLLDNRLADNDRGLDLEADIQTRYQGRFPCLFLTGESDDAFFAEAARRGVTVLRKPLKPIQLRTALMDAARQRSQSAA